MPSYNEGMGLAEHVMTVSRNGQVSIPAPTRARWNARQVVVVDLGDRVVLRPLVADPVAELRGKYAGRGPASDTARRQARAAERGRDR
jgi:AbrB family looped-hinge helix DNA binding protein